MQEGGREKYNIINDIIEFTTEREREREQSFSKRHTHMRRMNEARHESLERELPPTAHSTTSTPYATYRTHNTVTTFFKVQNVHIHTSIP